MTAYFIPQHILQKGTPKKAVKDNVKTYLLSDKTGFVLQEI